MTLVWRFLQNEAGEDEGLADAGIETFRDAPFAGLARECGQNSIDAARSGFNEQVKICFHKKVIPTESVPDISGLRSVIGFCLSRAKARGDDKEKQFFERAERIINSSEIELLQITDEGTTGLIGPCTPGTPYHALIKAKGVSKKGNDTSGGSFGIGKNAAYAISPLRSVFYSTIYADQVGEHKFLAQGKAILVSHKSAEGIEHSATGYWGESDGFMPADDMAKVPKWLQRTKLGTSVTAVGFLAAEQWDWRIAESLVRNFFTAIHNGQVVFKVGDDLTIEKVSLSKLFQHKTLRDVAAKQGTEEDLKFSFNLYRCLTSLESTRYEKTFPHLGKVKLSILIEDGLDKQVGLIRNGMFITSRFSHFTEKLARFPLQKDFTAIIEPMDHQASSNIRSMENPRHDELSPERIEDPERRESLRKAVNQMNSWIRQQIKKHTTTPPDDKVQLDDLNDFFSAPEDSTDRLQNTDNSETDPTSIKVKMRRNIHKSGTSKHEGREGGSEHLGDGKNRGSTGGARQGDGTRGAEGRKGGPVPVENFRNIISGADTSIRKIFFTPLKSGKARLEIVAAGMANDEKLPLTAVTDHIVSRGGCEIEMKEGERIELSMKFIEQYQGPIEIALSFLEESKNETQE